MTNGGAGRPAGFALRLRTALVRAPRSPGAWFTLAGILLIVTGLAGLGLVANRLWGAADDIRAAQQTLSRQFDQEDGATPSGRAKARLPGRDPGGAGRVRHRQPAPGRPVARMEIPRIGERWTVVQGIELRLIERAPGHYPNSAMPGEIGNFAVAGHRVRGLFWDLDKLRRNDPIIVQTHARWYVYRVTVIKVVKPTAVEVVAPVPGHPGAVPTRARLTLTTCQPKWGNFRRLIVHADLARSQPRGRGVPAEARR